ncbi:MAG: hypothetical protein QGI00_08560, partial [Candidatus Marinimicrobia bacterium]|nr:hypothetical protein [Candidatus Neomarinimicrobiota bacterium]
MEDEKNAEANSADGDDLTEDENLSGDQYEITVGDIDSGELDFDIVDFDVVDDEENGIGNEQVAGEATESDLGDLDFDVVTDEDYDEEESPDFENRDEVLDNLPPLDESDLEDIDLVEPLDDAADFDVTTQQDDFF